ncbi:MAG: SCP2 sterol-binding domain-containing protein, partial [Burkholderiales bacterium]
MLTSAIVPALNHLLRQANFARQKLRAHQSKIARIEIPPFTFVFAVRENGEVAEARSEAAPDVVLTLTPPLLFRILAKDETATRDVTIAGDGEFAADINFIAANLSYDAEEDLS